jgi:hypothetical protein
MMRACRAGRLLGSIFSESRKRWGIFRPAGMLYDATEAAELGEPGALDALIDLKLSQSAQFRDKPGGCALAAQFAKLGDEIAARRLKGCGAN